MTFIEFSDYRILAEVAAAERERPDPLTRKVREFAELPLGWSHGEGVPVTSHAVRIAESFIDIATRLQLKADVFPGLHGDCAVAFYRDERSVEVIIHPDGKDSFGLHVEEGSGFQFKTVLEKEDASHSEVVDEIVRLVTEAWKSHASSHSVSSTQSSAAFRTLSSSTPPESELAHPMAS